jgi:FtsP/CotA-like multicopper oxidase with cupredoxin domain
MNRRHFSKALFAGSAALPLLGRVDSAALAASPPLKLTAVSRSIDVNGHAAKVFGLMNEAGKPGLVLNAGEAMPVELTNALDEPTMVHWHGLTPQWQFDGVPDLPMPLLKAGEARQYVLPGGKPGTHWMHAHTLQEQHLLAAPLIVHGKEDAARDEQEVVILLHDFSFTPATELLDKLKTNTSMGNMNGMQMQGMGSTKGMPMAGMGQSSGGGMMQGNMMSVMTGMDVNDIDYDAYLANDRTLNDPQVTQVERSGKVRLRIINGATATPFTIDTGALDAEIAAVDGQNIAPFKTRQFPLAMGQRVDIRLTIPKDGGAFPILALREGGNERTGIILATSGAPVTRLAGKGEIAGPRLSLETEMNLRAAVPLAAKPADSSFTVGLVGSMQGYTWGVESDTPLVVREGDRVQIEMRNMSMMTHPMHLHGHHFQIVAINGMPFAGAVRDTVIVPHMMSVTLAFDAVNSGNAWAFHCHHLYHMATGMMATIGYEGA